MPFGTEIQGDIMKKNIFTAALFLLGVFIFCCGYNLNAQDKKPAFSINSGVYNSDKKVSIAFNEKGAKIFYTIDGTEPTEKSLQYLGPFTLNKTTTVKAAAISKNKKSGISTLEFTRLENIASIELKSLPPRQYKINNIFEVLDGKPGSSDFKDKSWLAAEGVDLEVIITFNQHTALSGVELNCLQNTEEGIYFPAGIEIYITPDGKSYFTAGYVTGDQLADNEKTKVRNFDIPTKTAVTKGVKIIAKNGKMQQGEGKIGKVFINKIKLK